MEKKGRADIDETVEILMENRTEEFYRLNRWNVLSARRFINVGELKEEARTEYYEQIESAMESL